MKKKITQEHNDLAGPSVLESATTDSGIVVISLISYNKIVQLGKKPTKQELQLQCASQMRERDIGY